MMLIRVHLSAIFKKFANELFEMIVFKISFVLIKILKIVSHCINFKLESNLKHANKNEIFKTKSSFLISATRHRNTLNTYT